MAGLKEDSLTSVLTVFSIEHLLIIFVVIVRYSLEDAPKWV